MLMSEAIGKMREMLNGTTDADERMALVWGIFAMQELKRCEPWLKSNMKEHQSNTKEHKGAIVAHTET